QLVNVLQAPILTEGDKMALTPTYHVLEMFKDHQDATALPLELETDYYVHGERAMPALSASASRGTDGAVTLTLANVDAVAPLELVAELGGKAPAKVGGRILAGAAMDARNAFDAPDAVVPVAFNGAQLAGSSLKLTAPPRSVIALKLWS
ncbi:MAG: alpha-N-arabinofuranosidase, partial [Acidobacteria bacterium]|nr:alpha-N-arabinofuranosidase [Acidobacteriota bacterium]